MLFIYSFTEYELQVLASSANQTSLPSDRLKISTHQDVPDNLLTNMNISISGNVSECCTAENVSSECRPLCSGDDYRMVHDCAADMPALLKCSAGM